MSVFTDGWLSGAISRVAPDVTAFPHRDNAVSLTIGIQWADPERDEELIAWAREFLDPLEPSAPDGVCVNLLDQDDDSIADAYGEWYNRIRELTSEWHPENLFRMN